MIKNIYFKNIAIKIESLEILITGASGFIGRNLVEYLGINTQHRLIALARLASDLSYIKELPP